MIRPWELIKLITVSRLPAIVRQKNAELNIHNISFFFFHYFGFRIELRSKIVLMKNENDPPAHHQILFFPDSYQLYRFPWPNMRFSPTSHNLIGHFPLEASLYMSSQTLSWMNKEITSFELKRSSPFLTCFRSSLT